MTLISNSGGTPVRSKPKSVHSEIELEKKKISSGSYDSYFFIYLVTEVRSEPRSPKRLFAYISGDLVIETSYYIILMENWIAIKPNNHIYVYF